MIKVTTHSGRTAKVDHFTGPNLTIHNVHTDDMGSYLCIADNGVPPIVSKRIFLYVQCKPTDQFFMLTSQKSSYHLLLGSSICFHLGNQSMTYYSASPSPLAVVTLSALTDAVKLNKVDCKCLKFPEELNFLYNNIKVNPVLKLLRFFSRRIGDRQDGVCLQLSGQVSRQPKHCHSAMLYPKGRASCYVSGSLRRNEVVLILP